MNFCTLINMFGVEKRLNMSNNRPHLVYKFMHPINMSVVEKKAYPVKSLTFLIIKMRWRLKTTYLALPPSCQNSNV